MSEYLVLLLLNANVDIHFNAHTKSKIGNPNNLYSLEAKTPKGLNRMANICPRGKTLVLIIKNTTLGIVPNSN